MKMVVAIIHTKDANACVSALNNAGFACTRLASSGGFLEKDNATLLVGVETARVDEVIDVLRGRAKHRNERLATTGPARAEGPSQDSRVDVEVGGATVFVLAVDRFERL